MYRTNILIAALAGTALAAGPAQAGGLPGSAGNCLCKAANGLAKGAPSGGSARDRSVTANVTGSVSKSLKVKAGRSIGRGHGVNAGLAGSVNSVVNARAGLNGMHKSIGLAGRASTDHQAALSVRGLGSGHGKSLAGSVSGVRGKAVNVSVLNKAGPSGRALANVSALNGTGGSSGRIANISVLNKSGTTGRSAVNVAALNGSGDTAGKLANVSILNKTGSSGRSAINVSALNGSNGTSGKLANVSVLNGRHGKGGIGLPNGVRIINGMLCGPDGKPLTVAAAATVMAMVSANNSSGESSRGPAKGGHTGSNGGGAGTGSGSSGSGGSTGGGGGGQTGSGSGANAPPPAQLSAPAGKASPGTYPFEDRINRDKY